MKIELKVGEEKQYRFSDLGLFGETQLAIITDDDILEVAGEMVDGEPTLLLKGLAPGERKFSLTRNWSQSGPETQTLVIIVS